MTVSLQAPHKALQSNVIAFRTAVPTAIYHTAAGHFGQTVSLLETPANDNHAPINHEGAITSDQLLDFLYGVARVAN